MPLWRSLQALAKVAQEAKAIDADRALVRMAPCLTWRPGMAMLNHFCYPFWPLPPWQAAAEKVARKAGLGIDGADLASLAMDFTLPGYPSIELKVQRRAVPVGRAHEAPVNSVRSYRVRSCVEASQANGAQIAVTADNVGEFIEVRTAPPVRKGSTDGTNVVSLPFYGDLGSARLW